MIKRILTFVLLAHASCVRADFDSPPPGKVDVVKSSVAWLTFGRHGKADRATGFVFRPENDDRKFIITAAHIYSAEMVLSARLPGMVEPVPCDLIDVDETIDLMAVLPRIPISAPALVAVQDTANGTLAERHPVWTVGCAGGLAVSDYPGWINAKAITADTLNKERYGATIPQTAAPRGETLLIRHNAFSSHGMSGGPLVDAVGKVVGVQIGSLPGANQVCFATSARHLRSLDFKKRPRPFGNVTGKRIGGESAIERHLQQRILVSADGREVDAQCVVTRDVSRSAKTFLDTYLTSERSFSSIITVERLQSLLDKRNFVRLTNTSYGFSFIVPDAYSCTTSVRQDPAGIMVKLEGDDPAVPAALNTISVYAFIPTDYRLDANRFWEQFKSTELGRKTLGTLSENPFAFQTFKQGIVDVHVIGQSSAWLIYRPTELGLRVRQEDGKAFGFGNGPVFTKDRESIRTEPIVSAHENYLLEGGEIGHAIHSYIYNNIVVFVHYPFSRDDRQAYLDKKPCSRTFIEHALIRSTMLLY